MKYILFLFSVLILFCGCSRKVINNNSKQEKLLLTKARDYFTDGMLKELNGEYDKALVQYYQALLYDSTSSSILNRIAKNHITLGRFESALRYLKNSLKIDPKNPDTHRQTATCYYRLKNDTEAIKHLEIVLKSNPFDEDSRNMLILLYRKTSNYLGLAEQYELVMNIYGDDEDLVRKTSSIYLKNGDSESAKILFMRYIQTDSTNASMWYSLARLQEIDGEIENAIKSYQNALEYSSGMEEAIERLHALFRKDNKWENIINLFSPIVIEDSTNHSAQLGIAEAQYYLGNTDQAKDILSNLTTIKRIEWPVYNLLGRIEFEAKNYSVAKSYYQKLIKLDEKSRIGWLFLGFVYSDMDSLESAEKHYQEALTRLPEDPHLLAFYGITLNRLNKDEEAILQLKKAIEIDKENLTALISYGQTLNKVGNKREAIVPLRKAITLDTENRNAITSLGMIYDELKMYQSSDSLYEAALKIFPENDLLLNNYAYSLADRNIHLEYALKMAKKAIEKQPDNAAYLDTMGWIYFRLKQYDQALLYVHQSVEKRDQSPVVIEHLGDIYFQMGDFSNAKKYWEKALQLNPDNSKLQNRINSN